MSATLQAIPRGELPPRPAAPFDFGLAAAAIALLSIGLVMVASASISTAERELGSPLYYFWRQGLFVGVGLVCAWITINIDLRVWQLSSPFLLLFGAMLLIVVLVPGIGREVNGAMRWIRVGGVNFQPSEPMKLFMALYLSGYLYRRSAEVRSLLRGFFKPVFVLSLIAALLLLEPDYGAAVVLFVTALGMMFLGGVPLVSFCGWGLLIGSVLAGVILAAPYRVERLTTFVDPWADPFGSGFQLTQALIAIGQGEWLGVGLGNSIQKLFYLPEAHTDFLFAVLAEEFGLLGVTVVIGLFSYVVWRAFSIARAAERQERFFAAYLAHGLGLLFGLQAFVNIGVNMGILPTKGLALPLMSYGGSSMVVNCVSLALLLRIDHESRARA